MRRTLAEIEATCRKAARGCGCPWGLAEEAGRAARVLAAHGLDGAGIVARLLDTPRACACACAGGAREDGGAPRCGIAAAAELSDRCGTAGADRVDLGEVAGAPLLLAVLLDRLQRHGEGHALKVGAASIEVVGPTLPALESPPFSGPVSVRRLPAGERPPPPPWHSRPVDPGAWASLEALAARTLVPETEASRQRGAGPDDAATEDTA